VEVFAVSYFAGRLKLEAASAAELVGVRMLYVVVDLDAG
jgi:hypothetical protein